MNKKLSLILLFALLLRIPLLGGSFWLDEAAQALEIIRPLSQQLDIAADFQPPLLHLILHFAHYFSVSEWWLRTIGALIPGLVTILFTYKLAEKLFNKNVAVLSSLFLATSSFHIFYSQELRPYSLPAMFGLISMYYFFQTLEEKPVGDNTHKKNKSNQIKLSIVNLLGLYSSYLFPFLVIAQLIFATKLKQSSKFIKTLALPIIGFLPWLPMFLTQLKVGGLVRKNLPGWEEVVSIPQLKAIPLVMAKFIFGTLDIEPDLFFIIFGSLVIIPLSMLLIAKLKRKSAKENKSLLFTLSWFILPLILAWLVSFYVPVVRPKRLLFLLPAFYILVAFLVTSFINKKRKPEFTMAIALLIATFSINLFSTLNYYTNPKIQRENWKGLYQNITEDFSPANTIIIYSFTDEFAPMKWYNTNNYSSISTGELFIDNVDDLANTLKIVVEYENALVFDYLRDLSDPNRNIEKELTNFGLKEIGALDYPNIGFVRIFVKPHALIGRK